MSLHNDYYVLTQHRHHEAGLARELKHRHPLPPRDRRWRGVLRRLASGLGRLRPRARRVRASPVPE